MFENINKILYFGASLNIQTVRDFPNVKKFIFIDNQPRSKSDRYYFSDRDYNNKFIDQLMIVTNDYGFYLSNIFILDETYHKKILNIKKMVYYSFFQLPSNINPELYVFINDETKQEIKYYISTNVEYNMNYSLLCDIRDSDALILNEYIPNIKLFDYIDKMKILIGYFNTYFSSDNNYIDILSNKFIKYYLINNYNDYNEIIECNDFMDIILQKIKILNKDIL